MKELKIVQGDLWDYFAKGWKIVITTNIGWDAGNRNNMGAGVALEACTRFRELPLWYGSLCKQSQDKTPVVEYTAQQSGLLFFPVKPLIAATPAYSWNQKASLKLITKSARQLAAMARRQNYTRIALGFPGCGNGQLEPEQVLPILRKHLDGARFVIVDRQAKGRYPSGHGTPRAARP